MENLIGHTSYLTMTILFNLKIVAVTDKGVGPIANALSGIIDELHDSTYILVTEGKHELRRSFSEVKEDINSIDSE